MDSQRLITWVVTSLVIAASVAGFFVLRDSVGPNAAVITVLPVAVVAAYFGTKWGLLATSIAFPANVFLLDSESGDLVSPFVSVSLLLVAWIFGQLHKLEKRQQQDAEERVEQVRGLEAVVQRNREVLDAVPDTIMRITDAGRIMELHGEHHLGLADPREDLLFRNVASISEPWQDDLLKLARSAEETGTARSARHRVAIGGEERFVESRVSIAEGGDAIVIARVIEGATIGPV